MRRLIHLFGGYSLSDLRDAPEQLLAGCYSMI
jgi:hypothetical protein